MADTPSAVQPQPAIDSRRNPPEPPIDTRPHVTDPPIDTRPPNPQGEVADIEVPVDDVDLSSLTRDELNDHARSAGVENPEGLPNKQAVIEAIEAR